MEGLPVQPYGGRAKGGQGATLTSRGKQRQYLAIRLPKWLKSLGTAGTSAFPILFTKLFWKMAKKFKKFGVLGCLIAVEEMADFTLWFQQKYDFFGTSSVLTPLVALKTQPNLWKQLSICQCISQGPKITKFELLEGFLALGMTIINRVNGGEKLTIGRFC